MDVGTLYLRRIILIDSKSILYSAGKNDECYTLPYAVTPILKYIPKGAVIWCPFDTEESEFVKQISKTNKVIHSHISGGGISTPMNLKNIGI